ncbi:MAG: RluA family pseudouridine synthase [Betaproteobacteria bacterium]|nr:RluA family pseudouridine synthase [Betaproteobacteria bacterium]
MPEPIPLIHADDTLLVFDKPSGLLAVPGRGPDKQDCLSARAQASYPDALIVHRLDMATSGLMLLARGAEMRRRLSMMFAAREVSKRYVAVVAGRLQAPNEEWGTIDLPIAVDWPKRPLRIVDRERGKPSVSRWRVLAFDAARQTTRVELEPITGRSHQLRVHMQALGHPILGDALYAPAEVQAMADRLLLHACALRFRHPLTGEEVAFESAPGF